MNFEGKLIGKDLKVVIVVSWFNDFIIGRLFEGVKDILIWYDVNEDNIDVVFVLGVFEIFLVVKKLVLLGNYDVVIILGCVICGVMFYYDYVCNEVVKGVFKVND